MMKRLFWGFFLILAFSSLLLFTPRSISLAQECSEDYRSCDQTHPCCNFPQFTCQNGATGGYCKPISTLCGVYPYPCCPLPNPPCAEGFVCSEGSCQTPTTPTPTPTCGMHLQSCCSTEPKCGATMMCSGGFCVPETTFCGSLGQPCCTNEPRCKTTNTECREGTCQSILITPPPPPTPTATPDGIPTALGKVDVSSPTAFIAWVLKFALGIGGGIAFLLMLFGSFQIITSSGQPEKVQAGKELITSALAGLLMIIFSVFLLELIGVKILAIPGFGK